MQRFNLVRNHLTQCKGEAEGITVEECKSNPKIKIVRLNKIKTFNTLTKEFGVGITNTIEKLDLDDNTKVITRLNILGYYPNWIR